MHGYSRFFVLFLLLFSLLPVSFIPGQELPTETSPQSLLNVTNIVSKAQSLQDNLLLLKRLWSEQKIAYGEALRTSELLRVELSQLKIELSEAQILLGNSITSSEESAQEVQRLTMFFKQLELEFEKLSTAFETYRTKMEKVVRNRTIAAGVATAIAIIEFFILLFRLLQ